MIKEIELSIPSSYADIPLKKWLELQKELVNYEGDEDATTALMLFHLCGLQPEYLGGISVEDFAKIKYQLSTFISNADLPLQRIIEIDGVEYGFEPNLSQMTYGAYADITKYDMIQIDENWTKIISVLYRPIVKKNGNLYTIKPYSGEYDKEMWLNVGMDVHLGALFFFVNLQMDLLSYTLNFSTLKGLPPNTKSILEKSGKVIQQSLNSQKETFLKLMK